jgi:hypothetical protein
VNPLQLNEVVQRIEQLFGEDRPFTDSSLSETDSEVVARVFQLDACQAYIEDQLSRRIIRDYLVNAVMLGCISDAKFSALSKQAGTSEGRSALSLHMLMNSVEAANDILAETGRGALTELRLMPGAPPHMEIVSNKQLKTPIQD